LTGGETSPSLRVLRLEVYEALRGVSADAKRCARHREWIPHPGASQAPPEEDVMRVLSLSLSLSLGVR
jgi:hypothetical protein